MPLGLRVRHAFREVIRSRGESYAHSGHVAVTVVDAEAAEARVRGSAGARYDVAIRAVASETDGRLALGASCTCPHFEDGEACKHLWATLVVLDARGWEPASLAGDRQRLELVDLDGELEAAWLEDDLDEEDDAFGEESSLQSVPRPRLSLGGEGSKQRGSGAPGSWRARIARLGPAFPRREVLHHAGARLAPLTGAPPALLYVLDPDEVRREQALRLHFARRTVQRDGSSGALRPARLAMEDLATVGGPEEAAACAQLLTLAQLEAVAQGRPYYGYPYARGGLSPSSVAVPSALVDPLLLRLAATGRLGVLPGGFLTDAEARRRGATAQEPRWLQFDPGPSWELRLELVREGSGYELRGGFLRGEETLPLEATDLVLAGGLLVHGTTLVRVDTGGDVGPLAELRRGPIRIPAGELDAAMLRLAAVPGLRPVELGPEIPWTESRTLPVPRLRFAALDADPRQVGARLDFGYGDVWVEAGAPTSRPADPGTRTLHVRDPEAETHALATLAELGFGTPAKRRGWVPPGGDPTGLALPVAALEPVAAELLAKGWILEAEGARLRRPGASFAGVRSGIDFFDLEGGIDFEGQTLPFPALLAAARDGSRFVRLGDGSRGLLPRAWLARCASLAGLGEEHDERLRFGRAHVGVVDALLAAQDESRADELFDALRRRLADFDGVVPAREPAGFEGTLRDYQRIGVGWLQFLRSFGLGGCLADDMGLGKTVQVLALLADRKGGSSPGRTLVVAPRSVVHGWVAEAARFVPALSVVRYTGAERTALREKVTTSDLVVTTYGTLRRDVEWLREQHFDTVVLDEAQMIKNAGSRTAQAARALRADHRLALTGTPVENHLGELASLLEFLNPGFLHRARGLEALGAGSSDPAALVLLARALRPLLLRRTKEQVLRELPAKTEQTLLCELAPAQRRQYEELRRHFQASLTQRIERQGLARSKIHVLEALLRLRQAACHPALLDPKRRSERSAKLDVLFENLEEVLDEGHKVLVFSQFTRLLSLVRERLDARGVSHAYLDGRTRDRKSCVSRFQEDPACRVFVISLKAGGTGLNLTAADYVFLLDPWWNPAVEAQAVDRTHRIGQTRPVVAYRLVAENTVEEKILALQERKRGLARKIFGDEKSLIGSLSAEDLRMLLG